MIFVLISRLENNFLAKTKIVPIISFLFFLINILHTHTHTHTYIHTPHLHTHTHTHTPHTHTHHTHTHTHTHTLETDLSIAQLEKFSCFLKFDLIYSFQYGLNVVNKLNLYSNIHIKINNNNNNIY